uniref:Trypsin n=1 Tax=Lygus lineolaris TaxID=50650 RepID=A0A184WFV1_LYGLI|nr:trypsin precursor [Lygus lineolaris]
MQILISSLLVALSVFSIEAKPHIASRIVGGQYVEPKDYPFMVGLADIIYTYGYYPFCGGSIITPNHVITAAHCTVNRTATKIVVLLGTHDRSNPRSKRGIIEVKRIQQHPDYRKVTHFNDISIVTVASPININKIFGRVCLPPPGSVVTGHTVTVIGYGRERFEGSMITRPKKLDTTVIPLDKCRKAWATECPIFPTQLCIHSDGESGCKGDSGGPVLGWVEKTNEFTLLGLVSYGLRECTDEKPSVHTRVAAFLPWIVKQIADSGVGGEPCYSKKN